MKQKIVKVLSLIGKGVGLVGSMNAIPGLPPEKAVIVFFVASVLKDVVNRVGDFMDDGAVNNSFK